MVDAKELGGRVSATLADPTWLKKPLPERKAELSEAFERLRPRQIRGLMIVSETKQILASVAITERGERAYYIK